MRWQAKTFVYGDATEFHSGDVAPSNISSHTGTWRTTQPNPRHDHVDVTDDSRHAKRHDDDAKDSADHLGSRSADESGGVNEEENVPNIITMPLNPVFCVASEGFHNHHLNVCSSQEDDIDWKIDMCPVTTTATTCYQVIADLNDIHSLDITHSAFGWLLSQVIRGLDHVKHEDIIPFTPDGQMEFDHNLADVLFFKDHLSRKEVLARPRDALSRWNGTFAERYPDAVKLFIKRTGDFTISVFVTAVEKLAQISSSRPQHLWLYAVS